MSSDMVTIGYIATLSTLPEGVKVFEERCIPSSCCLTFEFLIRATECLFIAGRNAAYYVPPHSVTRCGTQSNTAWDGRANA